MIAMQYSFTLPADYDMDIIRRRIADNGHRMDGFPGLAFKTFMSSRRDPGNPHSPENRYAPFYLWQECEGMNAFLGSGGFAALADSFGWPVIRTWLVWQSRLSPAIAQATHATREILDIAPFSALDAVREGEIGQLDKEMDDDGALAGLAGFDPGSWTLVRFRLWPRPPDLSAKSGIQLYDVGHVSLAGSNA